MDFRTLFRSLACCGSPPASQARRRVEWKVIKAGDRDYVSFANLAEFYQFGEYSHANRTISLRSEQRGIRAQVGTSELYINGVRFFTHLPLREQAEGQLVSAFDVGKIDRTHPPPQPHRRPTQKVETVVLDPGHGGTEQRHRQSLGHRRKLHPRSRVHSARELLLQAGFKVEMTRSDDTGISLEDRVAFANRFTNAVFVSIHFNSGRRRQRGGELSPRARRASPSNAAASGEHHVIRERRRRADDRQRPGQPQHRPRRRRPRRRPLRRRPLRSRGAPRPLQSPAPHPHPRASCSKPASSTIPAKASASPPRNIGSNSATPSPRASQSYNAAVNYQSEQHPLSPSSGPISRRTSAPSPSRSMARPPASAASTAETLHLHQWRRR